MEGQHRTVVRPGQIIMPLMPYRLLHGAAIPPYKKYFMDAGYDLATPFDVAVYPGIPSVVNTGLSIKLPHGTYGRIAPRSSLALRGIGVGGGVIDSTYTGEVTYFLVLFIYFYKVLFSYFSF